MKFVRVVFLVDREGERRPATILEDTGWEAFRQALEHIESTDLGINREVESVLVPVYPAASEFGELYNLETEERLQ